MCTAYSAKGQSHQQGQRLLPEGKSPELPMKGGSGFLLCTCANGTGFLPVYHPPHSLKNPLRFGKIDAPEFLAGKRRRWKQP